MKYFILSISFLFFAILAKSQVYDSVGYFITRIKSYKDTNLYSFRVMNLRPQPICLLHTASIYLLQLSPSELGLLKSEMEIDYFSLNYSKSDMKFDDMYENWNLLAQVILPGQQIEFKILIVSGRQLRLKTEFIILPNLCYNEFENDIKLNNASWYKKYQQNVTWLELPNK